MCGHPEFLFWLPSSVFPGNTADAFALRWSWFGIGCTICFGISPTLSMEGGKTSTPEQLQTEFIITSVFMVAALLGILCFLRNFDTDDDDANNIQGNAAGFEEEGVSEGEERGSKAGNSSSSAVTVASVTCANSRSLIAVV